VCVCEIEKCCQTFWSIEVAAIYLNLFKLNRKNKRESIKIINKGF